MTTKPLRALLFVHVFLFALVVGVFWGTCVVEPAACAAAHLSLLTP